MRINEITQEQKVNIKCLISKCDFRGCNGCIGCEILEFNE